MIKIKKEHVEIVRESYFDYLLENGVLLHPNEWNGENYTVMQDGKPVIYTPVYKEKAWDDDGEPYQWDIIGFEEY